MTQNSRFTKRCWLFVESLSWVDIESFSQNLPAGTSLLIKEGDTIEKGAKLTEDPNVGGFGQLDKEIVLQSKARVIGMIIFFIGVGLSQIMLVLKKKQVEKVQAAEGI